MTAGSPPAEDLRSFRDRLLNDTLLGFTIVSALALALSLSRVSVLGWQPLMALHLAVWVFIGVLWLGRRRFAYAVRAAGLLAVLMVVGYAGLMNLGLVAAGQIFAFLVGFAAMLFVSGSTAWTLAAANALCIALIGYAAVHHWVRFEVDYEAYAYSPWSWATLVWGIAAYGTVFAYVAWRMVHGLWERQAMVDRLLDEQRVNLEAAEAANLAKSTFLTSMSHELRTPLNAVIGFAQMLEMEALGPQDRKEAAGHILGAGRHLLELIDEVLDLARIESGRLELNVETLALAPLVGEAVTLMRPAAEARGVTIRQGGADGLRVRADRARLRQVLLNLLSNAVKYNRDEGRAEVAWRGERGCACVIVSDTGRGIALERSGEIFQPFQRLGAETTNIDGTGVGLVICKRLVEAMGGRIGFDSRPGAGSRFWVELPLAPAGRPDTESTAARGAAFAAAPCRGHVLYVEDSAANVQVMKHILGLLSGVELSVAVSGEEALAMIERAVPDLVLLDINLPGMDGYEVLKRLKADPRSAAIPVVAVSAAAPPGEVEADFAAYLTKPLAVSEVLDRVQALLVRGVAAGR